MSRSAKPAVILILSAFLGTSIFAQEGASTAPVGPAVEAPSATDFGADVIPVGVPSDFVLGIEDVIRIEVWRDDTLTRSVVIRPDGRFSMPLIGEVQALGLTPERLKATLVEALSEYMTAPEVTVAVLQVNSRSYTISGAVKKIGRVALVRDINIFQAINDSGGFASEWADKKKIIVIRDNGAERLTFNYEDFVKGKNLDKNPNFLLKNGDQILVQE